MFDIFDFGFLAFFASESLLAKYAIAGLATFVVLIAIIIIKSLFFKSPPAHQNPNAARWATKKEVKNSPLRIITKNIVAWRMIKTAVVVAAFVSAIFKVLTNLTLLYTSVMFFFLLLLVYAIIEYYVEHIVKTKTIPVHPEKSLDRFYAWLIKRFTPSSKHYYIGKYKGISIGIPYKEDSGRFTHMLVVGPTDEKKTSTFIIPQLLFDAGSGGSAFVPDRKSPEIYNTVAYEWVKHRRKVFLFDPWHPDCVGWEPLYGASEQELHVLVDVFMQEREDALKEEVFFKSRTRDFLFLLFKLAQTFGREYCNLPMVYKMVECVNTLKQFIASAHDDDLARKFEDFLSITNSEKNNYLTAMKGKLFIFMDEKVRAAFSRPDFELEMLFREGDPCLLIAGSPMDKKDEGIKIISLMANLLMKKAFREKTAQSQLKAAGEKTFRINDLYIYADEGRSLKIADLPDIISVARYTKTQILMTITDLGFFKHYREDYSSLLANFKTRIFLRRIDHETASYISKDLGQTESTDCRKYKGTGPMKINSEVIGFKETPLMPSNAIKDMEKGKAVVFNQYTLPFIADVRSIYEMKALKKKIKMLSHQTMKKLKELWGINTLPLEDPKLPMISHQFYNLKSIRKDKRNTESASVDAGSPKKPKKPTSVKESNINNKDNKQLEVNADLDEDDVLQRYL